MNYLIEYYQKVMSNEILAGEELKSTLRKLIDDMVNPRYDFDEKPGNMRIDFIETFCKHTKSPFNGQPFILELWEKAIIQTAYGFKIAETGLRRFNEVILLIARKNGKTTFIAGIDLAEFFLSKGGVDIVCASNTSEQANILFEEINNMREQSPALSNEKRSKKNISFSSGADFLITIDQNSKIEVDPYYDAFSHLYGEVLKMVDKPLGMDTISSGLFTGLYHALSKALTIPITNEQIGFSRYEAGLLRKGNSDPNSTSYDSLSDYFDTNEFVEIRIPYLLLNIMDPSTKTRMANFKGQTSFTGEPFDSIQIGFGYAGESVLLNPYTWEHWGMPTYHERLKQSYYIIQNTLKHY